MDSPRTPSLKRVRKKNNETPILFSSPFNYIPSVLKNENTVAAANSPMKYKKITPMQPNEGNMTLNSENEDVNKDITVSAKFLLNNEYLINEFDYTGGYIMPQTFIHFYENNKCSIGIFKSSYKGLEHLSTQTATNVRFHPYLIELLTELSFITTKKFI